MTRFFLKFIKVRERYTSQFHLLVHGFQYDFTVIHMVNQESCSYQDSSSLTNVQRVH